MKKAMLNAGLVLMILALIALAGLRSALLPWLVLPEEPPASIERRWSQAEAWAGLAEDSQHGLIDDPALNAIFARAEEMRDVISHLLLSVPSAVVS